MSCPLTPTCLSWQIYAHTPHTQQNTNIKTALNSFHIRGNTVFVFYFGCVCVKCVCLHLCMWLCKVTCACGGQKLICLFIEAGSLFEPMRDQFWVVLLATLTLRFIISASSVMGLQVATTFACLVSLFVWFVFFFNVFYL